MTETLRNRATSRRLIPLIAATIALSVGAGAAHAQSISNLSIVKNGTNSADEVQTSNPRYQRRSTVQVLSSSASSFDTRYGFLVAADYDGFQILGNSRTESLTVSYTISFQVTAPGAYRLNVNSLLNGQMNRIADGGGGNAQAQVGATTGAQTGGTLASGSLALGNPGDLGNGGGAGNVPFNQTASAVITGVSNGSPVNHTLTFTGFNPSCQSSVSLFGTNAPECAVRGGLTTNGGSPISAGAYPGSPARTEANDGHFITVTLESLCGNGVVDAGFEACDLSGQNGDADVCCTSSCQFRAAGQTCRGEADLCDQLETCTGAAGTCPADLPAPPTRSCRAEASICDLEDFCDGTNFACPADAPAPATRLCRAASDLCDVDDFCNGTSFVCGADNVAPTTTICRPVSGVCDAQDFCDGTNKPCPTDDVLPDTVLCRASAGVCDVDDYCPGNAPDCSADAREPGTVSCRAIADDCDLEDFCDGGVDCPADAVKPDVDLDGLCDEEDNCPDTADPTFADDDGDGDGNVCDACTNIEPVDIVNPVILLKRIHTPESDDTLKFTGTVTVPTSPTIDPIAKGVRFRFEDPDGNEVLDVTIPGGAYNAALRVGWKATTAGWKYKNVGRIVPLVKGINTITLTKDKVVPGRLKFQFTGKKGFYPVVPSEIPLKVSFVVDSPFAQTGQCGEALLTSLECVFDSGSTKLQCENPN